MAEAKVFAVNKAKISIGTTVVADTNTEFAADTYTLIGGVSTMTQYGDTATIIPYNVLAESRVRKVKGTFDAGDMTLTMAHDSSDPGQVIIKTALNNRKGYNVKVEYDDKLTTSGTNTIHYFRAIVSSAANVPGDANKVMERSVTLAIDTAIYEVAAS